MHTLADVKMSDEVLEQVLEQVHRHTGITMTRRKRSLLEGRLRRRLRTLGLESYETYLALLDAPRAKRSGEIEAFIDAVTTNETSFFRTPQVWSYFANTFLPRWYEQQAGQPDQTLKIWSAAGSTGEEACSITILCEEFRVKHPKFSWALHVTDISQEMVATAKAGVYRREDLEVARSRMPFAVQRYFDVKGDEAVFRPTFRQSTTFAQHNLFDAPGAARYDIIFLRNVLIYFSAEDKERVVRRVAQTLRKQGVLIIGETESLLNFNDLFTYQKPCTYERKREC